MVTGWGVRGSGRSPYKRAAGEEKFWPEHRFYCVFTDFGGFRWGFVSSAAVPARSCVATSVAWLQLFIAAAAAAALPRSAAARCGADPRRSPYTILVVPMGAASSGARSDPRSDAALHRPALEPSAMVADPRHIVNRDTSLTEKYFVLLMHSNEYLLKSELLRIFSVQREPAGDRRLLRVAGRRPCANEYWLCKTAPEDVIR